MEKLEKLALWYQISHAKFLGPVRFHKLWQAIGEDLGKVFTMSDEDLLGIKGAITKQNLVGIRKQKDKFEECHEFMKRQVDLAEQSEGGILTLDDPKYPEMLRKSKMCHAILYYIGRAEHFTHYDKSLAIVGTRKPAKESADLAFRVARDLASRGWVIVSGMARGIDTEAHKGALSARGKTIAVLGSGPDHIYSRDAKELYKQVKLHGLILSEYPFGTRPADLKLKKRNKTTVALSLAAFIVETGKRGGTMNAVQACKEQKKKAFALLPTWPCDTSGNEKAINDGAIPVTPVTDFPSVLERHLLP